MKQLYNTIPTLLCLFFVHCLSAQDFNYEKMASKLVEAIDQAPNDFHSINIVLADQVDLTSIDLVLREKRATANERSATVIRALREKATATQGHLLDVLKNSTDVKTETIGKAWIANALFAEAKKEMIAELSQDERIQWVGLNGIIQQEEAEVAAPPPFLQPNGIEPGLAAIGAPEMWAMGYTGYGQLAMTSDTGVDPVHPALCYQYYGHYVPKEQTWFRVNQGGNPIGGFEPFDNSDHGTHVTGTTLGLDRLENDTIGVAFNARWIGACTLCGVGTNDNVWAFEWALNPDGDSTTVDDMPDVINNSWWDPSLDDGTDDCFSIYRPVLDALEVAGIVVVFSAGNGGPDPETITPPKNININEVNVFSVGNLNGNSISLPINQGSSRGPSHCVASDSSLVIKPEVSAPGTSVRSCEPGGIYGFKTGTSMAAPHVSGAILLLKEAFPDMPAKDLKLALYHSCTDLGIPGEDNNYGMGIINVPAAFNYLVDQGHTPAPPHRANDVMLVNVAEQIFYCDGEVNPTIIVENAGTDTLFSFKTFYKTNTMLADYEWTGMLLPGERVELILPPLMVSSGEHELEISVEEPNGMDDERPLNNRYTMNITVSDRPSFEAEIEGPDNVVCKNTSALIRGVLPEDLVGTGATMDILWYSNAVAGTILGAGEAFTTPVIEEDETYFAEVTYNVPVGPKDPYFGESDIEAVNDLGLTFEVFYDCVLDKVYVFKDETGGVITRLLDANGEIIQQDIQLSSTTGELEIDLGWELTPGTYSLVRGSGKALAFNKEKAEFPYVVEDVLSITGTTDNQGDNGFYYYFYDWQVKFEEPCGRSPITVVAGAEGMPLDVDYSFSADTVNVDDSEVIQFNSAADNAVEWFWNFGDGTTSSLENPTHVYTTPGVYLTSLSAIGADSCSGAATYPIVVEESNVLTEDPGPEFDNILVYPNPVNDELSILIDLPVSKEVTLRLADYTGRIWKQADYFIGNGTLQMGVQTIPSGVYYLMIETDEGNSVWKVVKL